MKEKMHPSAPPGDDEPPPFGRSWRVLYALVLLNLVSLILLFTAFTRAFS